MNGLEQFGIIPIDFEMTITLNARHEVIQQVGLAGLCRGVFFNKAAFCISSNIF